MLTYEDKNKILDLKSKYSIYAAWTGSKLFNKIIKALAEPFKNLKIDKVIGIEGRGFILGGAVAYKLNAGFVVCRKEGQMYKDGYSSKDVLQEKCIDYSNSKKVLELEKHEKAIQKDDKVLIIDDWFEKGGQGQAVIRLVERAGGKVVGIGVMLDEMTNKTRKTFLPYNYHYLVKAQNN